MIGAMNPDGNINVVAVFPNGEAVYYGHADEATGQRQRLFSKMFPNYGAAVLAAAEYETKGREERARKTK
jgi:hypothetical protein